MNLHMSISVFGKQRLGANFTPDSDFRQCQVFQPGLLDFGLQQLLLELSLFDLESPLLHLVCIITEMTVSLGGEKQKRKSFKLGRTHMVSSLCMRSALSSLSLFSSCSLHVVNLVRHERTSMPNREGREGVKDGTYISSSLRSIASLSLAYSISSSSLQPPTQSLSLVCSDSR